MPFRIVLATGAVSALALATTAEAQIAPRHLSEPCASGCIVLAQASDQNRINSEEADFLKMFEDLKAEEAKAAAAKKAAEEAKAAEAKKAAEEASKKAAEAEAKRIADEQAAFEANLEALRKQEAEEKAAKEAAARKAAAEAEAKRIADEQAAFEANLEALRKQEAAEKAEKEAKEAAARKAAAEAEAKRIADEQAAFEANLEALRKQEEAEKAAKEAAKKEAEAKANVEGACLADMQGLAGNSIQFAFGRVSLTPDSRSVLRQIAEKANACPTLTFVVEGHTDNRGSEQANQTISAERAQAVVTYLVGLGVDRGRMKAIGYGMAHPIASNDTIQGRAENRRIEFALKER